MVCDFPVDLGLIDAPVYILATKEDHIVPWHSAYQTSHLVSGDVRFVLGASGHIAGVINPATKNKRNYWVCEGDLRGPKWPAPGRESSSSSTSEVGRANEAASQDSFLNAETSKAAATIKVSL